MNRQSHQIASVLLVCVELLKMDTQAKITYIRNTYQHMLSKSCVNWLYVAKTRSLSLIEAWALDGSISYEMQKELDKEVGAVYSVCVDEISKK